MSFNLTHKELSFLDAALSLELALFDRLTLSLLFFFLAYTILELILEYFSYLIILVTYLLDPALFFTLFVK